MLSAVSPLPAGDAPEKSLMAIHQASLRVKGVLHLLHEALQSGNGISPSHAAAICALIKNAEGDLAAVDAAVDTLIDSRLTRPYR